MPGQRSRRVPEIETSATHDERPRRRLWRRRASVDEPGSASGAWYPRWYWPSFVAPGSLWLVLLFLLPFYVVFSVAFGTVDFENFGAPVPYYAPWWWSFDTFYETLSKFYEGTAIGVEVQFANGQSLISSFLNFLNSCARVTGVKPLRVLAT